MNDRHQTHLSDGERTRFDAREGGAVALLVAALEEPSTWLEVPTARSRTRSWTPSPRHEHIGAAAGAA